MLQFSSNAPAPVQAHNQCRAGLALKLVNPVNSQFVPSGAMCRSVAALLIAGLVSSAHAADLGVIEIIGSESQQTAAPFQIGDTAEGEFTGFREVIEKEQLQQAGASLAEVIATESGAQFRQSGGLGSYSTISLRGSSAEQVNVYLDGVLLNDAAGGGVNLSHIELMQADKVEIYRGTVPVQLGNSAIGGAINITTTRATDTPISSLLLGAGSFGSSRFSTAYAGPLNWLNEQQVVASFSHRQSDNDFSFLNDNGTSFNRDDDEIQKRRNGQSRSSSGFLKTDHKLAGGLKLEHALQLSRHRQGISDWRNTVRGSATLDTDNFQWRSSLTRAAASGHWSSLWSAHYSIKDETYDDSDSSIGVGQQKIVSDTRVIGGRGYWERLIEGQSLSFSLRARAESLDSVNQLRAGNTTQAERLRSDINLQWNRYFNDRDSLFSASVFGFAVSDDYRIESVEDSREDFSDVAFMPQLGFHHVLGETAGGLWSFAANASRHQRVPSFFELFGNQGLFEGNSSLQTETSDNLDIGLEWRSAAAADIDAAIQVTLFQNQKHDLISRVYNARGVGRSENLSKAQTRGIELTSKFILKNGLSLDANIAWQDAENQSNISGFTGKQIPGEAKTDGSLTLSWRNEKWKAGYEYKFNADRFYDSPNLLPAADQRLHSLRLSRFWKNWRLDAELNNLTDQNYEDFNGYPKPGRAGFISVVFKPKPKPEA